MQFHSTTCFCQLKVQKLFPPHRLVDKTDQRCVYGRLTIIKKHIVYILQLWCKDCWVFLYLSRLWIPSDIACVGSDLLPPCLQVIRPVRTHIRQRPPTLGVWRVQWKVWSVQCAVCSVQCVVCSVQCAVILHFSYFCPPSWEGLMV